MHVFRASFGAGAWERACVGCLALLFSVVVVYYYLTCVPMRSATLSPPHDARLCRQAMWTLRESIPEALLREGYTWLYDVSLPHHKFYESVVDMRRHLSRFGSDRVTRICGFGHLGECRGAGWVGVERSDGRMGGGGDGVELLAVRWSELLACWRGGVLGAEWCGYWESREMMLNIEGLCSTASFLS